MSWEELQEVLFEQLFKTNEDFITLEEVVKLLTPTHLIWSGFEKILLDDKNNGFDFFKSVKEVKQIDGLLIIRIGLWKYIVIETVDNRCLSDEEAKILFDEEFFLTNFNDARRKHSFHKMYHFNDASSESTIKNLVGYFDKYQDILTQGNRITYTVNYVDSKVLVTINLNKLSTTIGFRKLDDKGEVCNVNYLFFNKLLQITGASNPTNNHESLLNMGKRAKEIKIPKSTLPKFINDAEAKKLTIG